jgi:hypothetical protein
VSGEGAITALINIIAGTGVIQIPGNILHASSMAETVGVGKFINASRVATVARATSIAVDHKLSVKGNRGRSFQVVHDVETISDG